MKKDKRKREDETVRVINDLAEREVEEKYLQFRVNVES